MFTKEQTDALSAPLGKATVKKNPRGYSYIEGWHAIAEANRIFGFDGWNRETIRLEETNRALVDLNGRDGPYQQWRVGYIAVVRICVGDVVRHGTGYGSGMAKPEALGDAIESAAKEAETDAMKRALMTFGNPFGLALYDKEQRNVSDVALPSEIEPDANTKTAIKLSEMLIVALRKARTKEDLLTWVAGEAKNIESLPANLCQAVRDAYKEHLNMLKEMEPAQ